MLRHHIANLRLRTSQYQESDGVKGENDGVKGDSVEINILNKTMQKVYQAIVNNPEIKTYELKDILNISDSMVTRATRELKRLGFIERAGSDKTGRWLILK